jgi:hypothetical protein
LEIGYDTLATARLLEDTPISTAGAFGISVLVAQSSIAFAVLLLEPVSTLRNQFL